MAPEIQEVSLGSSGGVDVVHGRGENYFFTSACAVGSTKRLESPRRHDALRCWVVAEGSLQRDYGEIRHSSPLGADERASLTEVAGSVHLPRAGRDTGSTALER